MKSIAARRALILAAILFGSSAAAFGAGLDLWLSRNQIYKNAGYCFKTSRAIETFGNAGCTIDDIGDVPLSANQRREIEDIVAEERGLGCRD